MIAFFKTLFIFIPFFFNINTADNVSIKQALINNISFDIYYTDNMIENPGKVIMLTHAFVKEGNKTPRLVKLSKALAKAGIVVMMPEIPGFLQSQQGSLEVAEIKNAVTAMTQKYPNAKKGVMTFCYANGPMIAALNEMAFKDITFIVLWGSYSDLINVTKFNLTGFYEIKNGKKTKTMFSDPSRDIVEAYYKQKYWYFGFPKDRRDLVMDSVKLNNPKRLKPQEMIIFNFLRNSDPRKFIALGEKLPKDVRAWADSLSVSNNISAYTGKLIILHNKYDTMVPFYESKLIYASSKSTKKSIYLPRMFEHADDINVEKLRVTNPFYNFLGLIDYFRFFREIVAI